jgi:hypothetical protein
MAGLNRPARLNRSLLAFFGIVLLAAGAFAITTSYGWLKVLRRDSTLVPGSQLPPTWVLYVAVVVAVLLGVLCLGWLSAQALRRPKTTTWRWHGVAAEGTTKLDGGLATGPFTEEVGLYPGVESADATLTGTQSSPRLMVTITAGPEADLKDIRSRLTDDGIARLKQALDLEELPTVVEFRFAEQAGTRVR